MDLFTAIKNRRSVRKYTTKTVPDDVINKALDAALVAPNSSNLQPWEFYWVKSEAKKSALIDACLFQATAKSANHLIVVVARIDTWKRNRNLLAEQMQTSGPLAKPLKDYYFKIIPFLYTHDPLGILALIKKCIFTAVGFFKPIFRSPTSRRELFEVVTKTTALACENFMLAITAQGYGTCPMEGFDEVRVKKLLNLNSKCHVTMIISVGEIDPAGVYGEQLRVPRNLVVFEV